MKLDVENINKARLVQEVENHADNFSGQFDLNGPIINSPLDKKIESPFFIPVRLP